eukprot:TRINITY_DN1046_c0_g1_i2.p1 TRINITY_DN1046_c0_g1~~TRINITY_DN1046_c0_g1_i2.p1  ORF type:complete len:202 (+),score=51.93 TRINITY_DN1046_c0_g1_i2:127-732(+)
MTTINEIKSICVFCGSRDGTFPEFMQDADKLAEELVKKDLGLVYGGGSVGVMGAIARGVQNRGGSVEGIIPGSLAPKEISGELIGNITVVADMHTRKFTMYKMSQAFIALPGGFGTFDELLECITWAQLGIHTKPIGILNTKGYYDHFIQMVDNSVKNGFIDEKFSKNLLVVSENPVELLDLLLKHKPPQPAFRWIKEDEI